MPIKFSPYDSVWVWLTQNDSIDFDARPRFRCKVFTSLEYDAWYDFLGTLKWDEVAAKLLTKITAWENYGSEELTVDSLRSKLSNADLKELLFQLPVKVGIGEDDLKKFGSQSHTEAAASASRVESPAATSQPT